MTILIRHENAVRTFKLYDKEHSVNYTDENGQPARKTIGKKDNRIDADEFRYALDCAYNDLLTEKNDRFYTKWIQEHGNIDAPIRSAEVFYNKLNQAIEALIDYLFTSSLMNKPDGTINKNPERISF